MRRPGTLPAGPEPWYTWQCRSPHWLEVGSWSCWTYGSSGAHISWEAGSRVVGNVAARGCMPRSLMCVARGPQRAAGCVAVRSSPCRGAGSKNAGHMAPQSPPHGSGAMVHVAMSEPTLAGRRVLELLDTWQLGAHLGWDVGFGAARNMAACGCTPHSLS
jgi:hypothetical protein